MSEGNGFRSWRSFADSDEVKLSEVWAKAVVQMALLQANDAVEKEGAVDQEAPFFEDAVSVFNDAINKNGPSWWPRKLERVLISIRATPNGSTTDTLGPHPLDPNSKDLGSTMFSNIIVQLMDGQGDPFSGSVNIQIKRASDKTSLGGWKRDDIYVGTKAKKKSISQGGDGTKDELFEYMADQLREKNAMMERMFANSASVIGASASLVNATRGVNAAPPWMNGEDGSSPMWMAMMQAALGIGGALIGGQNPGKTIQQIMSQPVQNNNQMMIGNSSGGNAGMLTDNGGGQIGGTDQFLDGGQYDGFNVMEDDLLEDDFETLAEESDPEDDEEEDSEEEEEDEEEEERPKKKGLFSKKKDDSGESLKGKSPEEVAEMLENWIPEVKDKGKLQQLGLKLASKIMR